MSIALYTLILLAIVFFLWRNFLKNKEFAIDVAHNVAKKNDISLLDETVCLRKIRVKLEHKRLCFYRAYSFDYNIMESFERYRAYIVLRNGFLDDVIISRTESVSAHEDTSISNANHERNVINFDE
ncbi:DUF3301 domain-containing protein [Pseudofrancisella aestuarii]|uniref:DUF3301 domain-containing protein n=1 Tax=Pseudofrancisella aestuarii TaxID=2670347 RepID=A0ABV9TD00_9GAMM|nr:DUF3301 domain-containing protein [Pseudofrancisella aestuarii]